MKYTIDLITADVPTENGRIYSRECLEKMCQQINEGRGIPLVVGYDPFKEINAPVIDIDTLVGWAKRATITKEGNIEIDYSMKISFTPTKLKLINTAKRELKSGAVTITPVITAMVGEGNRIQPEDLKLLHFSIVPKFCTDIK